MKPISVRNVEIYHCGNLLILEIEEYKTIYHVHFIDYRKYFSHLDTLSFKKSQTPCLSSIIDDCYSIALSKRYF